MAFYFVTVEMEIDTEKGSKKSKEKMLVEALSVEEATKKVHEDFESSRSNFEIKQIVNTNCSKFI